MLAVFPSRLDASTVQSRFIEAVFSTEKGVARICCLYLPNGNPVDPEKYPYKLRWMERLQRFADKLNATFSRQLEAR